MERGRAWRLDLFMVNEFAGGVPATSSGSWGEDFSETAPALTIWETAGKIPMTALPFTSSIKSQTAACLARCSSLVCLSSHVGPNADARPAFGARASTSTSQNILDLDVERLLRYHLQRTVNRAPALS